MQCLISKFTISGLGQVWDCQSYGEMVPSVPFPLSTGEWEVLLNNWRSIWIKGVNITVCNVILGAALKEGMDSPFSLCLAVVHSPRHSQTLLQVLWRAWCPEQYGDMGGDVCCSHGRGGQNVVRKSFSCALRVIGKIPPSNRSPKMIHSCPFLKGVEKRWGQILSSKHGGLRCVWVFGVYCVSFSSCWFFRLFYIHAWDLVY